MSVKQHQNKSLLECQRRLMSWMERHQQELESVTVDISSHKLGDIMRSSLFRPRRVNPYRAAHGVRPSPDVHQLVISSAQ
jgi:hypothetical protein